MLDTSLKRENSGEFEEDLPIEVNLPCNEDLQVEPILQTSPSWDSSFNLFPSDAAEPH